MIVGVITGTYSSVFVAAAIVTFWRGQGPTKAAAHAPATALSMALANARGERAWRAHAPIARLGYADRLERA